MLNFRSVLLGERRVSFRQSRLRSLGVLTRHPRSAELLDMLGPTAVTNTVLPVWRRHRLVRTDWPLDEQAYALQALTAGFLAGTPGLAVSDPGKVIVAAVTALLCPEVAGPAEVRAAAGEGIRLLRERREAVLSLIMNNHA